MKVLVSNESGMRVEYKLGESVCPHMMRIKLPTPELVVNDGNYPESISYETESFDLVSVRREYNRKVAIYKKGE